MHHILTIQVSQISKENAPYAAQVPQASEKAHHSTQERVDFRKSAPTHTGKSEFRKNAPYRIQEPQDL